MYRVVNLPGAWSPLPLAPSPMTRMGLGQALSQQVQPQQVVQAPPLMKNIPPNLTKEQAYELAGQTIVNSGNKLAAKMNQVYNKYKDTGNWGLAEAATAFFAGGPAGPFYAAADLWWQSKRQNEAVVALEASRKLGQEWMNAMTQDETGWLPTYLDGIESVNPALAEQVGFTFDKVNAEWNKVVNLLKGVRELPASVISQFISSAWGGIKNDLQATGKFLTDLAEIVRNIAKGAAQTTDLLKQLTAMAPAAAVVAAIGLIIAATN